eukprot:6459847-Amphidinium_carterae.1
MTLDDLRELWGVSTSDWAAFKDKPLVLVEPHVLAALIATDCWSCILTRAVSLNRWRLAPDVLARFRRMEHPPRTWLESVPAHEHVSGQSLQRQFSSSIACNIADLLRKHSGVILQSSAAESSEDVHWQLNEMLLALDTFHDQTELGFIRTEIWYARFLTFLCLPHEENIQPMRLSKDTERVLRALFAAMKLRRRRQLREVVSNSLTLVTAGVDIASMVQASQQLPSGSALFRCQLFCDAAYCGYMATWLARQTGIQRT